MIVSYSSSHKFLQGKIHLIDINKILMLFVTILNFRNFFVIDGIERWKCLIICISILLSLIFIKFAPICD